VAAVTRKKTQKNLGSVVIDWISGETIPADKLTKLGTREEHEQFTRDMMGHNLL
jgi:hypothetical protein